MAKVYRLVLGNFIRFTFATTTRCTVVGNDFVEHPHTSAQRRIGMDDMSYDRVSKSTVWVRV